MDEKLIEQLRDQQRRDIAPEKSTAMRGPLRGAEGVDEAQQKTINDLEIVDVPSAVSIETRSLYAPSC